MANSYILNQVREANDMRDLLANSQGVSTELTDKPTDDEQGVIDGLFELLGDIWESSEDFASDSDWIEPLRNIDNSLGALRRIGWRLYATTTEQVATNPFTGKPEIMQIMFATASKKDTDKIEIHTGS